MDLQYRRFAVGPDPFGRHWTVEFRWLQTGISIRHADTVDVKFMLKSDDGADEEKVVALPHAALIAVSVARNHVITDPWCLKVAALHVRRMIETAEDMEKVLITLSEDEIAAYDRELRGEASAVAR